MHSRNDSESFCARPLVQFPPGMMWPSMMPMHGADSAAPRPEKRAASTPTDPAERKWSGFVGVCWNKRVRKWAAQSRVNGKTVYLGYFVNEEDAARKYDENAKSLGRPLNFPADPWDLQAQKCAPRFPRSRAAKEANEEVTDQDLK